LDAVNRILVTGASGFFGGAALRALQGDNELFAVARNIPEEVGAIASWRSVDLLAPRAARAIMENIKPTHLLHFAWNATPGKFWTAKDNLDWVAATLRLYRAFADLGGQRFVGAGTCAEYDWSEASLHESQTPLRPATLYGQAKASTFEMLHAATNQDGVSFAWGRIFFAYGPREQRGRLVSDLVCEILAGGAPACSEGLQERDFMHIDDYGAAFAALLSSDVRGAVNIASGACRPVRDVVQTIADQIGRPDAPKFGARPAAPNDPPRMSAVTDRLHFEVGFQPAYTLEAGIADTISWWRHSQQQNAPT
jgi:nucleoside-diphosphate-sugar epimerase